MVGCRQRLLPPELNIIEIAGQNPNKLLLTGHVRKRTRQWARRPTSRIPRDSTHTGAGTEDELVWFFDNVEVARATDGGRHRQTVDMDSGIVRDMVCCSVLKWRSLKSRQTPRTPLIFARNALRDIALNLFTTHDILLQERSATRVAPRLRRSTSAMRHTLSRLREALGDPVLVPAQARRQPAGPRSGRKARPGVALWNWAHRCRNAI